jgi:hypothetical protein
MIKILLLFLVASCSCVLNQTRLDQLNSDPNGGNGTFTTMDGQTFANTYSIDWLYHTNGIIVAFNTSSNTTYSSPLYNPANNSVVLPWTFTVLITSSPNLIPPTTYSQVQSNMNGYCIANYNDSSALNAFSTITIGYSYCGLIDVASSNTTSPVNYTTLIQFNWNITNADNSTSSGNFSQIVDIFLIVKNVTFDKFMTRISPVLTNNLTNYEAPVSNISILVTYPLQSESPVFNNMGDIYTIVLDYDANSMAKQTSGAYLTFTDNYNNLTAITIRNGSFDITTTNYEVGASFITVNSGSWQYINFVLENIILDVISNAYTLNAYSLMTPYGSYWNNLIVYNCEFITNPGTISFGFNGFSAINELNITNNIFISPSAQIYIYSDSGFIQNNYFWNVSSSGEAFLYFDRPSTSTDIHYVSNNAVITSASYPLACYYFTYVPDPQYNVTGNGCQPLSPTYTAANYGILYNTATTCSRDDFHLLWLANNNTILQGSSYYTFCESTTTPSSSNGCQKYCTSQTTQPSTCYINASMAVTNDDYGWNTFPTLTAIAPYCSFVFFVNDDVIAQEVTLTNSYLMLSSYDNITRNIEFQVPLTLSATMFSADDITFTNPQPSLAAADLLAFENSVTYVSFTSTSIIGFTGGLTSLTFNCDNVTSCSFTSSNIAIINSNTTIFEIIDSSSSNFIFKTIMSGSTFTNVSGTIIDGSNIRNVTITNNQCSGYCECDTLGACTTYALFTLRMATQTAQTIEIWGNNFENQGNFGIYTQYSTYSWLWINGPFNYLANTSIYDNLCYGFPVCYRASNMNSTSWLSNNRPQGRVQNIDFSSSNVTFMREWLFYNTDTVSLYVDFYSIIPSQQSYYINNAAYQCTDYCLNSANSIYCLVSNQSLPNEAFTYPTVQSAVTNCPLVKADFMMIKIDTNSTLYSVDINYNPTGFNSIGFEPYSGQLNLALNLNGLFSSLTLYAVNMPNGIPSDSAITAINMTSSTITGSYTMNSPGFFLMESSTLIGGLTINSGSGPLTIDSSTITNGVSISSSYGFIMTNNQATCQATCNFYTSSTGTITGNTFTILNNNQATLPQPGVAAYGTSGSSNFSISGNNLNGNARLALLVSLIHENITTSDASNYASSLSTSNNMVGSVYDIMFIYEGGTVTCNGNCNGISVYSAYSNNIVLIAIFVAAIAIVFLCMTLCGGCNVFAGNGDLTMKLKIASDFSVINKQQQLLNESKQRQNKRTQ